MIKANQRITIDGKAEELGIGYERAQKMQRPEFFLEGYLKLVKWGRWYGEVLIYTIHESCSQELNQFLDEVAQMGMIRHENIVLFMGACIEPQKLAVITRCDYGCIPRGHLSYISPELMSSLQIDPPRIYTAKACTQESDLFAFGSLLFELLAERFAFHDQPPHAIIWQVSTGKTAPMHNFRIINGLKKNPKVSKLAKNGCQHDHQVAKNDANLALFPRFRQVHIESPLLRKGRRCLCEYYNFKVNKSKLEFLITDGTAVPSRTYSTTLVKRPVEVSARKSDSKCDT
ncbi:kinase suppressor of Ras 2 [Trichonephila clavipes]|nr:kinase suppressor of Ras 2 [Trichonephila clavipes]